MEKENRSCQRSPFALGFEHGAEAVEDAPLHEIESRVPEYRIGYVIGRTYSEAIRQVSLEAGFKLAGALGARFDIDKADLVSALQVSAGCRRLIEEEYVQAAGRGRGSR
ncbi:hypothetical protein BJG93_00560 [Paraburkholderia sprentiae WSM5005]|uniref:Uncharacterized protein n=1 Tax=Paraburkholderia sprentiae WSM5005 TaxID=754502 RepID=A0A1I9YCM5_9BURK|nr:hypothetical protein [Paraburkholderia sprentiae]APA84058.1 hypothetical protein BJG93_00560 [Paraburkholderia sprentiae WSM5005]